MNANPDISITDLRADLNGSVIAPDDPGYDDARGVFFTGFDRRPAAIVHAADASEVARAVNLARETGAELAVRSGGHSRAGHGTSDGGIVLDLSEMNAVEIDAGARTAWAQPGVEAGDYTRATGEHGLATGLGDTASVGVGGITLGGGIGFLVRKNGLTIDDVLGAEVVTADGELLEVDGENHPDLFWALRGGGGNFGVVTRLRFRLHEIDEVVGGMLMLPASVEVIDGLVAAADAAPEELSRDREHHEGSADAVHPRRGARPADRDRADGLRGRGRARPAGDRADPRARDAARRHGPPDPLPGDVRGAGGPAAGGSPRGRTCSSIPSRPGRRRRSSSTSRPPAPRWRGSSSACSAGRWRAFPTMRRRSGTAARR